MEYPFKDLLPLDEVTARQGYYKDWAHIDADTFHQISELATFIREKGYGADTREAIAQALERVYHDAAKSGNANVEVSMARGGFDTLGGRLDDTTAQLAHKAPKEVAESAHLRIDELVIESGDANAEVTDAHVSTVKNKSFTTVRNRFEEMERTVHSPATNLVSNGDFSSGNTGWATRNGTLTITDGVGLFTATAQNGQVENSITPLINGHKYFFGVDVDADSDLVFISIAGEGIVHHDGNGLKRITNVFEWPKTSGGFPFYVRDGRASGWTQIKVDNAIIIDLTDLFGIGKELPLGEMNEILSYFPNSFFDGSKDIVSNRYLFKKIKEPVIPASNSVTTEKIVKQSVTPQHTTFMQIGKNKFDKNKAISGYYISDATGALLPTVGYYVSDFIEIEPNESYSRSYEHRGAFYDADKQFISGFYLTDGSPVIAPNNAKYIRVSINHNIIDTYQIEKGSLKTDYEPFVYKLNENVILTTETEDNSIITHISNKFKGKTIDFIGDSFTAVPERYHLKVTQKLDLGSWNNFGISQSSMASRVTPTTSVVDRLSDFNTTSSDAVVILIGINDFTVSSPLGDINSLDTTTFIGAYRTTIESILTNKPAKRIILVTPARRNIADTGTNSVGATIQDYVDAAIQVANLYALPYVDLFRESGINSFTLDTYLSDGLHPNYTAGADRISDMIVAKLINS